TKPHPLDDAKTVHLPLALTFQGQTLTVDRQIPGQPPTLLELTQPISLIPYLAHTLVSVSLKAPK
ncbi:MAG: hypothetical protein LBJ61_08810, partial [Deltaproteobacteria bacterium]|nr:hypothetical protein [Deltaproteobacteria bacterium]